MKSILRLLFLVSFLAVFSACSLMPAPRPTVMVPPPPPPQPSKELGQIGLASWYGPGFHGKKTASGAIFNQNEMTAAHQTLPIGTRVMVTNLDNGKSVEVTITDRGPFVKGRIIDLSYGAAQSLGMIESGTLRVRVEIIEAPTPIEKIRSSLDYTLQLGSFVQLDKAERFKAELGQQLSQEVAIVSFRSSEATYYRVQMGTFSDREKAQSEVRLLAAKGYPIIVMEKPQ